MTEELGFRWWGNGGIELRVQGRTLLIDPLVTRPSLWQLVTGRLRTDRARIAAVQEGCDFCLVTCPRWDHFLDVPEVVRQTGATAYGAEGVCRALRALGVPTMRAQCTGAGDQLDLGPFGVRVLGAEHGGMPTADWVDRQIRANLAIPASVLRGITEEGLDCYGFQVRAADLTLLIPGQELLAADILFLSPALEAAQLQFWLAAVRPLLVVLIYWDDILRPLAKPVLPYGVGPRLGWPPLRRLDVQGFAELTRRLSPQSQVLVPERFRLYDLTERLDTE